jgi:GIY-YIG catalytic domain
MSRDYNFWIYIVTNRNHSVLYIGVTNRLSRRIWEHREGTGGGFAADYCCNSARNPIKEVVARQESGPDKPIEFQLARLGRGRAAGQIASRDFSTSLEMTTKRAPDSGAQHKIVTKARLHRS